MKLSLMVIFIIVLKSQMIMAQDTIKRVKTKPPIPMEVLVGNNRFFYQLIINRTITENNRLGIFNASIFNADYKNEIAKNEYGTSTALYGNIFKGIGVHAGATFNSGEGINPFIGLQYMLMNKTIQLLVLPSYYFLNDHKITNLVMFEYKPILNQKWSIYTRIQAYYAYNIDEFVHSRSYLYTRLGLTYSRYSFGLGANIDWYGELRKEKDNFGFFFRVNV